MPKAAPRPCNHPGCGKLVHNASYCEAHAVLRRQESDAQRGSAHERGYGYKWQKASKAYLAKHPLCECDGCQAGNKRIRPATLVDHVIPHKGDMKLFWDSRNWQAMSKDCHDRKTATQDGGFGRGRAGQKSGTFGL